MKRLALIATALFLAGGVGAQTAPAATVGDYYQTYVYCTWPPGAILVTYTYVGAGVWRQTDWRVLWGCGS